MYVLAVTELPLKIPSDIHCLTEIEGNWSQCKRRESLQPSSITHLCKVKQHNYASAERDPDKYSFLFLRRYYWGLEPGTSFCRARVQKRDPSNLRPRNTDSPTVRVKPKERKGKAKWTRLTVRTFITVTHPHTPTPKDLCMWFLTFLMTPNVEEVPESHFLTDDTLEFPQSLTSIHLYDIHVVSLSFRISCFMVTDIASRAFSPLTP